MTKTISVTVTLGEKRVTLEGPEDFVRAEVQRLTDAVATLTSQDLRVLMSRLLRKRRT